MTITTYAQLKSTVADWAARDDLTSQIEDFVTLAETIFNYGERNESGEIITPALRTRDTEVDEDLTVTSGIAALPNDFLEAIRVKTSTRTLIYVSPRWYTEAYPNGDSTDPRFYTVIGSNLYAGTDVNLLYYQKIGPLTTTNWLLTKSPNVYLFGTLYQLYLFTQAADKAAGFRGLMLSHMNALLGSDVFAASGYERRASATAF